MSSLDNQLKAAENEWLAGWKSGPNFWENKPALIIFWRHYGCSCGMERAHYLQQEYDDYIEGGADVVIIGQGEPEPAVD
jgi:hypothetical protein